MYIYTYTYWFFVLVVVVGPQLAVLLSLHSGVISGGTGWTIWNADNETLVSHLQGKCPNCCAYCFSP